MVPAFGQKTVQRLPSGSNTAACSLQANAGFRSLPAMSQIINGR